MALAFNSKHHLAALGLAIGDIVIYDTRTWEIAATLRGHSRGVTGLAFSADGRRLASCTGRYCRYHFVEKDDRPGEVMIWDTTTWQNTLTLTRQQHCEFLGVGFADDDRSLYAVANRLAAGAPRLPRGEIVRWSTSEKTTIELKESADASASGEQVAALTSDTGFNLYRMSGYTAVAVHPAGRLVAAFAVRGQLMLWDAKTGEVVSALQTDEDLSYPFGQLAFAADGSKLMYFKMNRLGQNGVSEYSVPVLKLTETRIAQPIEEPYFELSNLNPTAYTSDGALRLVITQPKPNSDEPDTTPRQLKLVQAENDQEMFTMPFEGHAYRVGFDSAGKFCYLLSLPTEHAREPVGKAVQLQRWSVPQGTPQKKVTGFVFPTTLSPDLATAVTLVEENKLYAIDLASGERSAEPVAIEDGLRGVVFFPDSKRFATYGAYMRVHLWDVRRPAKRTDIE
jgi:WD40 repeat protein